MPKIIGILGEKLAGKDTVAEYLVHTRGADHIKTSKILDELLWVLGLPITRHNEIEAGRGMELVFGQRVIGETVLRRVEKATSQLVVLNGLRMEYQFEDARQLGAKIIYLTAPVEVRHERSLKRLVENKDNLPTLSQFIEAEKGRTEVKIPVLGAQADFKIENTGTLEELYGKIEAIMGNLGI